MTFKHNQRSLFLEKSGTVFDAPEIILDLRAGEGGDDSKQFVQELFDAYLKYCRNLNLQVVILDSAEGHITARITGIEAGKAFRHESGKHCIQRIPDNSRGKKQTSIVTVGILPIRPEEVLEPLHNSDLEVICQTGKQGAGGQNVNKVASCVRMRHTPTGLSVMINGRDQGSNKREALKILTAKVNDKLKMERDAEYSAIRKAAMADGGRSDKTRTYNLLESRITDHRLGTKTQNIKGVLKNGDFGLLFK